MPITILRAGLMRMCSTCAPMALKHITGRAAFSSTCCHAPGMEPPAGSARQSPAAVNPEDVRPITDYVADYVRSAVIVNYQVVADIYVPYGVDTATVLEKATAALNEYTASVHLINATAARSGIDGRAASGRRCYRRFAFTGRRRRCDDGRSASLYLCENQSCGDGL